MTVMPKPIGLRDTCIKIRAKYCNNFVKSPGSMADMKTKEMTAINFLGATILTNDDVRDILSSMLLEFFRVTVLQELRCSEKNGMSRNDLANQSKGAGGQYFSRRACIRDLTLKPGQGREKYCPRPVFTTSHMDHCDDTSLKYLPRRRPTLYLSISSCMEV